MMPLLNSAAPHYAEAAARRLSLSLWTSGGVHCAVAGGILIGSWWGVPPWSLHVRQGHATVTLTAAVIGSEAGEIAIETPAIAIAAEAITERKPQEIAAVSPAYQKAFSEPFEISEVGKVTVGAPEIDRAQGEESSLADMAANAEPAVQPRTPRPMPQPPGNSQVASIASSGSPGAEFDELPRPAFNPAPIYPPEAKANGWMGRVVLSVRLNAAGQSESVTLAQTSGIDILDRAALEAVRQWRFTPGKKAGHDSAGSVRVPIVFRLDR